MKILLLSHIFPPAIDGGSKGIWKLGQYLKKEGHQVLALSSNCYSTDDFVTPNSKTVQTTQKNQSLNNINIIRLPVYKSLKKPLKALKLLLPKNSSISQRLSLLQKGPIFKIIPFLKTLPQILSYKPFPKFSLINPDLMGFFVVFGSLVMLDLSAFAGSVEADALRFDKGGSVIEDGATESLVLGGFLKIGTEVFEKVRMETEVVVKKTDPGILGFFNTLINSGGETEVFLVKDHGRREGL